MKHIFTRLQFIILFLAVQMVCPVAALAFNVDVYAPTSVLASGKWVKISVEETGVHFISASSLRSWGFKNPSAVRIYGYGGAPIADRLTESTYIDDLPMVQAHYVASGIYFYAQGPVSWSKLRAGQYTHTKNPFSDYGYYFLTENDSEPREIPTEGMDTTSDVPVTEFTDRLFHDNDLVSLSESGHRLLGEDFRFTRSRSFNFNLPGHVQGTSVWLRSIFATTSTSATTITITANGNQLPGTNTIPYTNVGAKDFGNSASFDKTFEVSGDKLTVGITFNNNGATVQAAHLDALIVNYTREIALLNGKLGFTAARPYVSLKGGNESTHVWDVTNPQAVVSMRVRESSANAIEWTNVYSGERSYVAWNENATYPSPRLVGSVANQNLHGIDTYPDMVIFTVKDWAGEAERLANLHRNGSDHLTVEVVVQDDVFNEFSSGSRDFNAFRRMLKMIYDRGAKASRPLRYALMMGAATYDNRFLTGFVSPKQPVMPTWQTYESITIASTYTSDDPLAILGDNTGSAMTVDEHLIAIGRLPVRTLTQAKQIVDKIYEYEANKYGSEWKNQVVLIADDGNGGDFLEDSEAQFTEMMNTPSGREMSYTKIYVDAFTKVNNVSVIGRERLYRMLDEGTLWLNYVGHGNETSITAEGLMYVNDINNMYNKRWPVLFAATCLFNRYDGSANCAGEALLFNTHGGTIASMAPTRESYVSDNGALAKSVGKVAFARDVDGRFYTIGEIFRRAKNGAKVSSRPRYVLLGDPALRMALPENRVVLERINGEDVSEDAQNTIMARQLVTLEGSVYDVDGTKMTGFTGPMTLTMYDAEYSTTSYGLKVDDYDGVEKTFEEQGQKLYSGRDSVINGEFKVKVPMPTEVADNFRPAALNMYASSVDGVEAIGCHRQFYVYGFDESAAPDDMAPVIDYAYLNHESYKQGSTVNEQPTFIAKVSDDTGINMSTAGIGHQMTLKLDDKRTFTDVSLYYTPSSDGTQSGTIVYPVSELTEGNHTLTFRVWDTSGNSASRTLDFFVERGAKPKLFDIYTDANPASVEANFYITHNRPDAMLTVTLDIYDMMGRRVWTTTVTDRSDLFHSAPIKWNLCDSSGRRLSRGIYIYRATVMAEGHELQSAAKRIAITGR